MNRNAILIAIIKVALLCLIVGGGAGLILLFFVIPGRIRGEEVAVPNLVNQSHQTAIQIVYSAGLQLDPDVQEKPSAEVPTGHIIEQEPSANFKVKRNKPVRITLSLGNEKVTVPDVAGKILGEADTTLKNAGFRRGRISAVHSDLYPEINTVIAQTPFAEATHQRGDPVHLLLSLGVRPKVLQMPELQGIELDQVRILLESHGLKIGKEEYKPHPEINHGWIINHKPAAGDLIQVGQVVDLEISGSHRRRGDESDFVEVGYRVSLAGDSPKRVQIFVEDDRGRREVIDNSYEAGFRIRQPYKVVGEATMIVYEDGLEVKREKLEW